MCYNNKVLYERARRVASHERSCEQKAAQMTEKRREARKQEAHRVTIESVPQAAGDSPRKISFSITEDISLKGIKVMCDTLFPVNTLLKMELSLAELDQPLQVQGKVKWTESQGEDLYETGIEFVNLSAESARALVNHMYQYEEEF